VVLAAGQNPVEQLPSDVAAGSDELGPGCIGGVMIGPGTKVVGIGYAGSRAADVLVHRLFTGGRTVPITAAVAADTVAGLLLLADARSARWRPGYYEVAIERDGGPARYVFCVGERGLRGLLSVPADAAGVDAYRDAIAQ
jgi:hypothetical protein